ncbi:sulfurtransferase [Halobacterium zhouii]|uniref:sulfurtransferase n=1 Tax=Halobacterium zhouii TaxID=2902624 RepID=UPI001E5907AD|nr:sulfurtransferase [Halobacterium zhouii]
MTDDWVVSADWLADNLEDVRVVDVRDPWEYDGIGHVPGAVNVPFESFRSGERDGEGGMMPDPEEWADLLGEAGVSANDALVAYDDTHGVFAARFLVTALYFGHDDLHLLDGDYSGWIQGHEATTDAPDVTPVEYELRDRRGTQFVDAEAVSTAVDDPDSVVVDTRDPEEFAEGHVPGAVNLDWRELVDGETRRLKPRDEIESILEAKGVTREKHVLLYCNTARRISHTFVVLSWLGFPDVAFYEGSLTDWVARGHPVE